MTKEDDPFERIPVWLIVVSVVILAVVIFLLVVYVNPYGFLFCLLPVALIWCPECVGWLIRKLDGPDRN